MTFNPATGKKTRIHVDLATLYPTPDEPGTELSFEEVWLRNRGWMDRSWDDEPADENALPNLTLANSSIDSLCRGVSEKIAIHHDPVMFDENGAAKDTQKESKGKKMKVVEVNRTQISRSYPSFLVHGGLTVFQVKANLDSPSKPKLKKRGSAEPTMTVHTKAATDEIYEIFNKPLEANPLGEEGSGDEDYETDGDYTSGAESTTTTRQIATSEAGDDLTEAGDATEAVDDTETVDDTSDARSVSEWSDFSARKHIPNVDGDATGDVGEATGEVTAEQAEVTQVSDLIDAGDPDASGHANDEEEEEGDEDEVATPIEQQDLLETRTTFIPIPPEDYEPRTRPYRDPAEVANNRLPFMTPITERTESSLDIPSDNFKTPSRRNDATPPCSDSSSDEVLSSPLIDIINDAIPHRHIKTSLQKAITASALKAQANKAANPKGPIIKDAQCNPVDEAIRSEILSKMQPPLSTYTGFYDRRNEIYGKGAEIRKFSKANSRTGSRNSTDKTASMLPPVIHFPGHQNEYTLRKEIGAGAFAPVYLVENSHVNDEDEADGVVAMGKGAFAVSNRSALEALKMETPPTPWEFYMMRLAQARLGPHERATASLSHAHEMHLYRDEGFLFIPFHPHGTLLDVVNHFRAEASGVMDEQLAMFFAVELLRTVEALHAKGLMHGDLKPDNCLLRLDCEPSDAPLASQYKPDGSGGWAARGVTLIDFGRGIDMRAFAPDVSFVADWKTTAQDCAEMREGRPWTWQMDYHGLASIVHCLLFGRYIETVRADAGGLATAAGRRYRVRESLKRYWQTDIWQACFDLLLNPAAHAAASAEEDGARMPVLKGMRAVRLRMEEWLVGNCERGTGLKGLIGKVEAFARARR